MIDDGSAPAYMATPTGILLCLRMLAEEAAEMNLGDTLAALRTAIQACEAERSLLAAMRGVVPACGILPVH